MVLPKIYLTCSVLCQLSYIGAIHVVIELLPDRALLTSSILFLLSYQFRFMHILLRDHQRIFYYLPKLKRFPICLFSFLPRLTFCHKEYNFLYLPLHLNLDIYGKLLGGRGWPDLACSRVRKSYQRNQLLRISNCQADF